MYVKNNNNNNKQTKTHQKVGIYLNIIKAIYDKPIANIILMVKR